MNGYIFSRSWVSASLQDAAPELGAARIHARSVHPENPSRQPDSVVHIRIRVDGTRRAKENMGENRLPSVWEEIKAVEGEHYERK